ncbi:tetratricopeptide repeat protein [Maricaulis maris]|jgi:tetratricopeptide (TPR) repeat protein|uniref:tetratricopeptide repeat protein n=1 Tax=Maricaulis maris TaxID=74318 RepID=UPI002920AD49|nr:hypothetical protein MACH15_05360 [Maricaulis maris]
MRALILVILTSIGLTAPSAADLTDLRARLDGEAGQIWIAFDEPPTALTSEVSESGLVLILDGVTVRPRAISPASDTLLAAVSVDPLPQGGIVRLFASRAWSGARAELRQGGVLVSMTVGPAPQVHIAEAALVADHDAHAADLSGAAMASADAGDAAASAQAPDPLAMASTEPDPVEPAALPAQRATPDLFAQGNDAASDASSVMPPGVCVNEARAVADSPWDDDMLYAQAACLNDAGYLAPAASIYEQMLAFEPENFRATVALAEIRVGQGDSDAAAELYNQATAYAISDAEAARARARLRALREP